MTAHRRRGNDWSGEGIRIENNLTAGDIAAMEGGLYSPSFWAPRALRLPKTDSVPTG